MSNEFFAVAGQDVGTCEALNWAWLSIESMVIAEGDDHETVLAEAIGRVGHDDVRVFTGEGEEVDQ